MLHESIVTPMHHHNDADDELIVRTGGREVSMCECEADGYVVENFDQPELYEVDHADDGPRRVKRRHVLGGVAAGFGALLAGSLKPRYSFADTPGGQLLVCVFLRGGFDGLSAVAPLGDSNYLKSRPTIGVKPDQALALDGNWGLNPHMAGLHEIWKAGQLAIIQGSGSPDVTRSHFQDQATVERAAPANVRSGWLGRHIQTSSLASGTFRGITVGDSSVFSLATSTASSLAVSSIEAFNIDTWGGDDSKKAVRSLLEQMYGSAGGRVQEQATNAFQAVDELQAIRSKAVTAEGVTYPDTDFGKGLAEIAKMVRAGVAIEVACIDLGGWDMHRNLGTVADANADFSKLSKELADGLSAFRKDLGGKWANTTVVTMSEFGRRVAENGDQGLDHGQGNTMFVMGGGVKGKVYGQVPELAEPNLKLGDVPISLDYRQALSEIVSKKLGNNKLDEVFPGFKPSGSLGIV